MIFNFQAVWFSGLENCLDRLAGGQIESGFAELDSAKLLIIYRIPFQFHTPTGEKGEDYDLDVIFQNKSRGCADTKCYIESLEFRASRIKDRLNEARAQLPPNCPGVVIMKIPQQWRQNATIFNETISAVKSFLDRSTQRIVNVIVYSALIIPMKGGGPKDGLTVREFTNKKHKFDKTLNWDLFPFGRLYVPGLGSKWISFWNMYENLKNPVLHVVPRDDDG